MSRSLRNSVIWLATILGAFIAVTADIGTAHADVCGKIEFANNKISIEKALPAEMPLAEATQACLREVAEEAAKRPRFRSLTATVRVSDKAQADRQGLAIGEAVKQIFIDGGLRKNRVSVVSPGIRRGEDAGIELTYQERHAGQPIAKVVELDGSAAHGADLAALSQTSTGTALHKQEYLDSQDQGRAITELADKSQLQVEPASLIRFKKVSMNSDYKRQVEIEVVRGTVNTVATHSEGASFLVVTKSATVEVKGTVFRTSVTENGSTRVEVEDGEVVVGNEQGKVEVGAGQGAMVELGQAPEQARSLLPMAAGQRPLSGTFAEAPTLSWEPVVGASGYVLDIAANAEFNRNIERIEVSDGASSLTVDASLPAGKWFWRVRALDADGFTGMPSKIFAFNIEAP